jgi:hypothetical protein
MIEIVGITLLALFQVFKNKNKKIQRRILPEKNLLQFHDFKLNFIQCQ